MWELLRRLKDIRNEPWVVLGDFNECLCLWRFEHFSARCRSERQMLDFREMLSRCDLHDLGFSGLPWTYDNMQKGKWNVHVRLDRVVASSRWKQKFSGARVQHIVSSRWDHGPILLELDKNQSAKIPWPFRYEIMWEHEESLSEEITSSWHSAGQVQTLGDIACALRSVRSSLSPWSSKKFGSVMKEFEETTGLDEGY
jgi:hypothetical protein